MQENIIETKTCRHCNIPFSITDTDIAFYDKISPVFAGKKYLIPTPTLCPDCRQQRRLSFRNERKLYKRQCDATGKDIVSMYSPDKPYKVYNQDFWYSDHWNPFDYGKNFDFTKSFFEQFQELMLAVPRYSLLASENENSNFTNHSAWLKDCYLIYDAGCDENCYYSTMINYSNDCIDCLKIDASEQCYECVDCQGCFGLLYSTRSSNCKNSYFLHSCTQCEYCFGCANLVNKQYVIFNKQYSKEKYFTKIKELLCDGINKALIEKVHQHILQFPCRENYIVSSQNCSGNNINSSSKATYCFDVSEVQDIKYCQAFHKAHDCMDVTVWGGNTSHIYNCMSIGPNSTHLLFCILSYPDASNLMYCSNCMNGIKNCFGCVGLHNNQSYCILNKQYTKEQYEELVPKIIEHMQKTGEWGEFFPSSISPFGYNETIAQEYFPLSRDEVVEARFIASNSVTLNKGGRGDLGFNRSDYEAPFPKVEKIISADKLPDDISKIPDDILNWAIECEITKKPFRIIKQELEFYRKHHLPVPHKHPDQRHLERMNSRNPRKLFSRKCDKCGVEMQTTYSPNRPEKVYCEKCYNKEVY